ncbi:MAG: dihydrodipicolinate synthase family protein [Thermoanaerobaculia bacterium]
MAKTDFKLTGVLPPITTPFDERGDLDLDALVRNVERYNGTGLAGYVAFGSNGEAVHLTAAERRQVLDTLRRTAAPDHQVVAGVNELSTRAAIAATRAAAAAGADAVLVITPYFYKSAMSQDLLRGFYLEVAAASPLPLLIYNVPQNTGVVIEPRTVAALASHANVAGVKDSAGDLAALAETVRLTADGFVVLVGNAGIFYPALMMGAAGAILAAACVAPEACVELHRAVAAGDAPRARDLQQRLAPLARMVTVDFGVAGLKAALDLAGFHGGPPRSPLRPLGVADRRRLAAEMKKTGFFTDLG